MKTTHHEHKQEITTADAEIDIVVGGTIDGEMTRDPVGYGFYGQSWESMTSVSLENIGDEVVADPWIDVDGRCRWRTMEEILENILTPDMDDGTRARAIWEFARSHRYHSTTGDDEVKDTVKMLNVYGYTLCWDEAFTLSNLWQAAGLKIRRGLPHGHCTTEVFYDGAYHLLDSDEHLLVLDRDNETIVSEAQISHDHDLMKRSHTYGVGSAESRETSESAASLFCHDGPRSGGRPRVGDHTMALALRPGERLEWRWSQVGKYHGFGDEPPRYANGRMQWMVPITQTRWAASVMNVGSQDTTLIAAADAEIIFEIRSPYVLVGGQIRAQWEGTIKWSAQQIEGEPWLPLNCGGQEGAGPESLIDLDSVLPSASTACYGIRIRLQGDNWKLGRLQIDTDLQMAPLSLPALRVGANALNYSDRSERRHVRLHCQWQERADWAVPPAVVGLSPNTATLNTDRARLGWTPVDAVADYHVRLGTDATVEQSLSPVFDKLISLTPSAGQSFWTLPEEGLLNPETDYFWKVRARSAEGVWGPWSQVAQFRISAPGVPQQVSLMMDWETRIGTLRWRPNPLGTRPVSYEIYGSDERGFSARRQPYEIYLGNQSEPRSEEIPGNLVAVVDAEDSLVETNARDSQRFPVLGSHVEESFQRAFYRIVAVDAEGVRSGPSGLITAPRPFVTTTLPRQIHANRVTTMQIHCLRSRGDLRSESIGPRRYHSAFRDGDELEFLLDEGPDWISLTTTGLLTMTPPAVGALGNHTVTLRIRNGQGGVEMLGWDVDVQPETNQAAGTAGETVVDEGR